MQAYFTPALPILSGWPIIAHLITLIHFMFVNFPLLFQIAGKGVGVPSIDVLVHEVIRSQALLGWLMLGSSLAAKFVGLPQQIVTNFKDRASPEGYKWFIILGFVSYLTQSVQAASANDYWMVVAQAPGAIFTAALVIQMRLYKKPQVTIKPEMSPTAAPRSVSAILRPGLPPRAMLTYRVGDAEIGIPADLHIQRDDGRWPITRCYMEAGADGQAGLVIEYGTEPPPDAIMGLNHDWWVAYQLDAGGNPGL